MEKILSKIQIAVIIPDAPPLQYMADWIKFYTKSAPEMAKALEESIPNFRAYFEKIVKPGIDTMKGWIPKDYRSKHGRTYQDIINTAETNARESYKKWREKLKRLLETVDGEEAKRLREKIEYKAYEACLRAAQISMPFEGYGTEVRGVASFAARWLSGDETAKALITDRDKVLAGGPVLITTEERASNFRNKFIQRIKEAGSPIMTSLHFDSEVLQAENDKTNELVNKFLADGFAKFSTGGESHTDFMVIDGKLYLEIQISRI